jgi:hypothetical protein
VVSRSTRAAARSVHRQQAGCRPWPLAPRFQPCRHCRCTWSTRKRTSTTKAEGKTRWPRPSAKVNSGAAAFPPQSPIAAPTPLARPAGTSAHYMRDEDFEEDSDVDPDELSRAPSPLPWLARLQPNSSWRWGFRRRADGPAGRGRPSRRHRRRALRRRRIQHAGAW